MIFRWILKIPTVLDQLALSADHDCGLMMNSTTSHAVANEAATNHQKLSRDLPV